YFGGQKINEIFAESASNVGEGWEYLPYQAHANSLFSDTVGQAYVSSVPLLEALDHWQEASISYGDSQGFSVSPNEGSTNRTSGGPRIAGPRPSAQSQEEEARPVPTHRSSRAA